MIFIPWRKPYLHMNKTYYTKTEDGSFHPITITQNDIADMLTEAFRHQLQSTIADKVASVIESLDLASEAQRAIDSVDMDDIASEAVRDEIENRINSMDIDVSVSL